CSSRRRHTRSKRDWSSDVCSSDLGALLYSLSRVVRPAELHSRSAEENCSTVNVSSLRSVKVATPPCAANAAIPCGLAVRKQHNCCSPPASLKKPNTEN